MSSSLVDLSTELQLKITRELLAETYTEEGLDNAKGEGQATKHDSNLVNWSCTSSYFRDLLAPYIFESVKLQNNDKSGSSLLDLSKSRYNELVKEVHFVGSAPGDARRSNEGYRDTVAIFPEGVNALLSNLRVFPNLETLSIRFDYLFNDYSEWEESDEEVKKAEEEYAWRALMAKTYEALIRNEIIGLKALEIEDLVPRKVSTFTSQPFRTFLSRLERFSLSIYGEDNGAGWMINTHYYYDAMMAKLDEYFFNHLASATAFALKAPEEGPLGLEGMNHIRLAFRKGQMPLLKTLDLEYIFVCPELIEFLLDHVQTLEHLSMQNCSSSINGLAEDEIHWKQLLNALADANPERLSHLQITNMTENSETGIPLTYDQALGKEEDEEEVSGEVEEARRILQADPNRRLFAHTNLDDKYGMLDHDEEENLASFQQGEDQASYERLMRIVNANAANSGGR